MLSDEQLRQAFDSPSLMGGLRAVEAAVRADQIEKDAHLADQVGHLHNNAHSHAAWEAAEAIRAQLTEGNGDE